MYMHILKRIAVDPAVTRRFVSTRRFDSTWRCNSISELFNLTRPRCVGGTGERCRRNAAGWGVDTCN